MDTLVPHYYKVQLIDTIGNYQLLIGRLRKYSKQRVNLTSQAHFRILKPAYRSFKTFKTILLFYRSYIFYL